VRVGGLLVWDLHAQLEPTGESGQFARVSVGGSTSNLTQMMIVGSLLEWVQRFTPNLNHQRTYEESYVRDLNGLSPLDR